jgi:YesN/AraC family two-component response regulator
MKAYFEFDREINNELYIYENNNNITLPHFHSNIEMVYVLEGELTVTINGATKILKTGDISIAANYAIHAYQTEAESKSIVLVLPLSIVKSFSTIMETATFLSPFLLSHPCSIEILHCLQKIVETQHIGNDLKIKGYLYIILSLLIDNIGLTNIKNDAYDFLPRKILIYMQQNYLQNITLCSISEQLGYSKYYISRFFKNYFKCGFNDYLNTLRIRHAAKLISESKMGMIEICFNSGFENQRTFNRAFHRVFDITPSAYKKNQYFDIGVI